MIKTVLKKPARFAKKILLNTRATYYLKKSRKTSSRGKEIKVGFIVFEPETWGKLDAVYTELKSRKNVICEIIIVPSYDQELKLTTHYGKELQFFRNISPDALLAYTDENGWLDISKSGYDYVFYQDPYNAHMPKNLKSSTVVKFAKICYIPYGFSGSNNFNEGNTNPDFFRNVYLEFVDTEEIQSILNERYKRNVENGYQHFLNLGYPTFDYYLTTKKQTAAKGSIKNVLWTPRWSYDPKFGGSHFLEYKEDFLRFSGEHTDLNFAIRPHPMMLRNFVNNGYITEAEKNEYLDKLKQNNVNISLQNDIKDDFEWADVLITDYSSIIPMFFLMNKPIIYCPSQIELNKEYQYILRGMYLATSWGEVEKNIKKLANGIDDKKELREQCVTEFSKKHIGAAKRIVDTIVEDNKRIEQQFNTSN